MLKEALIGNSVDYSALISEGAIVVDVRSEGEFLNGHANRSINIPLHLLSDNLGELQGKTVVVVCRSGARSGQAKKFLETQGIEAYNARAWQNVA